MGQLRSQQVNPFRTALAEPFTAGVYVKFTKNDRICLMIDSCAFKISVHLYEPRNICIWLTPKASNQVDDAPFKSFPFVRLIISIHVHMRFNDFGKSGKLGRIWQTKMIIVWTIGREFPPFYATRVDRCRLPIGLCPTVKASRKTLLCNFRPSKGEVCCAMHWCANERVSIFNLSTKNDPMAPWYRTFAYLD